MSRNYLSDPAFNGGLSFGNPDQIKYLREWNTELSIEEDNAAEGKKLFRVHVSVHGSYFQDIWASSSEEAERLARDEYDIDYCDVDVDYDSEEL